MLEQEAAAPTWECRCDVWAALSARIWRLVAPASEISRLSLVIFSWAMVFSRSVLSRMI